jgi:predicted amidophosphoribosyltransferase
VLIALIAWLALWGGIGYLIGAGKGRGDEGALLGILLGPIGLLIALLQGDKRRRCEFCHGPVPVNATACPRCHVELDGKRTRCRFCRESVALDATICPHCQKEIVPACNVICANCGSGFNLSPAALGHVARCPRCKTMTPTKKPAATIADPNREFLPAFGQDRADKAAPLQ